MFRYVNTWCLQHSMVPPPLSRQDMLHLPYRYQPSSWITLPTIHHKPWWIVKKYVYIYINNFSSLLAHLPDKNYHGSFHFLFTQPVFGSKNQSFNFKRSCPVTWKSHGNHPCPVSSKLRRVQVLTKSYQQNLLPQSILGSWYGRIHPERMKPYI